MLVIQFKKTGYKTKISEIGKKITDHDHDKYITTPEFNKSTAENFPARLAQTTPHKKPYFRSPAISWKAQKDHVNIIFPSTFWLKKRPHFPSLKSSKQELFSNQEISSFHQLFRSKKTVFSISEKFKTRTFQ